jgi:rsbT co-antagonist protein RsbR
MHPTSNTPGPEQTITPSLADMAAIRVEDAYRFFFERTSDMLCIVGADGYFKELNSIWERVLGYTHAELCSARFIAFVHPDDQAATLAETRKLADQGVETIAFENRYQCKDGAYRWLRWSASPDHEHGLIYAIARDVTEQREAATALQASEARFREITQNIPGAVFQFTVRDGIWTVDFITERIQEIAGVSAAEVMHDFKALMARVHPEDLEAYTASVVSAVERLTPWMFEGRYVLPDGSIHWWQGTSTPVRNNRDEIIFNGFVLNITDRKQAEEAIRQSQIQQEIILAQQATLEELSTPLIPISDTVMVMPLIGSMDSRRAQQVLDTLLHGVAVARAEVAIIDITGVSIVDTQVANALIRAAQAVKLLGAQVMLTGIRPEVAQTLVGLGVDLGMIITRSSLQSGIALAMQNVRSRSN